MFLKNSKLKDKWEVELMDMSGKLKIENQAKLMD